LRQFGIDASKIKTKEDITMMICEMIIPDIQPISSVEDKGFRKLLNFSHLILKYLVDKLLPRELKKFSKSKNLVWKKLFI
jgi:hypothetical protein